MADPASLQSLFSRRARRVRGRLAMRQAVTGAAIGLMVGVLAAAVVWRTRHGSGLVFSALGATTATLGIGLGLAVARRKRWSDTDVALYLDKTLRSAEVITTALQIAGQAEVGAAAVSSSASSSRGVVVARALAALESREARKAGPGLLRPIHALVPAGAAIFLLLARARPPSLPPRLDPPGTGAVQLAKVDGLQKAILLAGLDPRDDAQRARLAAIAKDAAKLKRELAVGMQKREAQDRIAHLRDALAAERLSLGDSEHRAGLESAVARLAEHDVTRRAAKALGDHDLTEMDAQMEKLANERETADREAARRALESAAEAARKNGAPDVAAALDEEKEGLSSRGKRADMLRELSDAMKSAGDSNEELEAQSESLDRDRSDAAARRLADSMRKALQKLTREQRQRLAQRLASRARAKGLAPRDAEELGELAESLGSPEGQQKLEDALEQMARQDQASGESRRQQALDDAERGTEGTERQLGGQGRGDGQGEGDSAGRGQAGQGQAEQGGAGQGDGHGADIPVPAPGGQAGDGSGQAGSHDTGTGDHHGRTDPVAADTMRSRAKGPLNRSAAMPGTVTTYTAGRAGGTANTRGTGDLRIVGPSEVDGVERSEVPQEYQDHVRQYFQP